MTKPFLEVDSIQKQYQTVKAVENLSFRIDEGEIFSLLGPNGAGKTTTVRMLLRIIRPDSGVIRFSNRNGEDPRSGELGYLPEERGLYREISILKQLTYMGALRGMRRTDAAAAARQWLERLDLGERSGEKLDTLSKGNQQKVQFIAAILHKPVFAILDEPFAGLDPINQELFLDIISELRLGGMTILLCAHQMNLVERLADRVLLLNAGRQVLAGTISEIKGRSQAAARLNLSVEGEPDLSPLRGLEAVLRAERTTEGRVSLTLRKGAALGDVLAMLGSTLHITAIHSEPMTLHEIFLQTVAGDERGNVPR